MKFLISDEHKKSSGIYVIRNTIDSRIYIGSALEFRKRWRDHKNSFADGNHHNTKLRRFIHKHGVDKLEFDLIEICSAQNLLVREQYYIDLHCCVKTGFNINPTAGSSLGIKRSQETIEKQRLAAKGKRQTQQKIERSLETFRIKRGQSAVSLYNSNQELVIRYDTIEDLAKAFNQPVQLVFRWFTKPYKQPIRGFYMKLEKPEIVKKYQVEKQCPNCGISFITKKVNKGKPVKTYCSIKCGLLKYRRSQRISL